MTAIMKTCALAIFAGAMANAATTTSTTLTVNNATVSLTTLVVSGTATLTNFGSGPFSASITQATPTISANFSITLSGGAITGTMSFPLAVLSGSGSGSATVTGGTGGYAGATGSFPTLSGTGGLSGTTITLSFQGSGSITVGGATGTTGSTGATGSTGSTGSTGATGATGAGPTITAVLDAGSYTANIAEGSVFVVQGANLSASGFIQFGFPLPSTCTASLCSGATSGQITFTPIAGGTATQAYLVYLYNQSGINQLAAILPSGVATGNYNVTVTNNNGAVSAPFPVSVVQQKPEMVTQDSTGSGLAVVQNYISATEADTNRFTTEPTSAGPISPAHPGQTLIAWLTGLGPIAAPDNVAAPLLDVTASSNVKVVVGGMSITPTFAGRVPGLAGEDQINFVLPSNVPTGCTVSFQISANGVLSTSTFIAIAPDATSSACVLPGFTTSQLQSLDNGATITTGGFQVTQFSTTETIPGTGPTAAKIDVASGAFASYTGFRIASLQNFLTPSSSCQVSTISGASQSLVVGGSNLDAGAVTLTGPSGSGITNLALQESAANAYSLSIATELSGVVIPGLQNNVTVIPGAYTLKGAGGKDVGAFNASMTLGSPLTITGGLPTTVTRASGLTLNWTGGNSTDLVVIVGGSGPTSGSTEFVCTTTAGKGTFTVPASILNQLPASSAAAITAGTATSFLLVESSTNPSLNNGLFSAPLTAGGSISNATFLGLVGTGSNPAYQ